MCEPTTIMMGLSIASAVASAGAQVQAGRAQSKSNAAQYKNALLARDENANQINLQRGQEAEQASQKIQQNATGLREAQGSVVAQAGPGGMSVDAVLNNLATRGANYNDSVNENLERVNLQADNQLVNVNRGAASTINALKPVERPDFLGAALKIGGAGYAGYKAGAFNSTPKLLPGGVGSAPY